MHKEYKRNQITFFRIMIKNTARNDSIAKHVRYK